MSILDLKARTALATEIARVDRHRFSMAVASGFYPCAPETVRGSTRVFDVNDIIAMRVYGILIGEGVTPRWAGQAACGLRRLLGRFPAIDRALFVTTEIPSSPDMSWHDPSEFDPVSTHWSGLQIISVREWRISSMREAIVSHLEQEAKILGDEDEA